ncbi:MAG: Ig-like domain-containing protein [Gammaproteobacteria bacterium]
MKLKLHSKAGRTLPIVMLVAIATAVSGCGGNGSGSGMTPTPQNTAPQLSPVTSQTINQDTPTAALAFTVNDDGGAAAVTLMAASTNADLLPASGIALGGSGGARTITVTPAEGATGSATVTIVATDAQAKTASASFTVTVAAVTKSIASYTSTAFAQMENDSPAQVSGITFVQDADDEATFTPLLQ